MHTRVRYPEAKPEGDDVVNTQNRRKRREEAAQKKMAQTAALNTCCTGIETHVG